MARSRRSPRPSIGPRDTLGHGRFHRLHLRISWPQRAGRRSRHLPDLPHARFGAHACCAGVNGPTPARRSSHSLPWRPCAASRQNHAGTAGGVSAVQRCFRAGRRRERGTSPRAGKPAARTGCTAGAAVVGPRDLGGGVGSAGLCDDDRRELCAAITEIGDAPPWHTAGAGPPSKH